MALLLAIIAVNLAEITGPVLVLILIFFLFSPSIYLDSVILSGCERVSLLCLVLTIVTALLGSNLYVFFGEFQAGAHKVGVFEFEVLFFQPSNPWLKGSKYEILWLRDHFLDHSVDWSHGWRNGASRWPLAWRWPLFWLFIQSYRALNYIVRFLLSLKVSSLLRSTKLSRLILELCLSRIPWIWILDTSGVLLSFLLIYLGTENCTLFYSTYCPEIFWNLPSFSIENP